MDQLNSAANWLESVRLQSESTPATYVRAGISQSPQVNVTWGATRSEVEISEGIGVRAQVRDALVSLADLVATGMNPPFPKSGDRIVMAGAPAYQVMELGTEGAWRWSDNLRTRLRVHLKEVGS
ncbi:MAG: hypothetical protein ABSF29_12845 [Tepidisphaeraceae bacterium]